MVALTVELRFRQHQGDGHALVGGVDQWAQHGAVVGWAAARGLGHKPSPVHIHDHGPLEPVAPGKAVAAIFGPLHEAGAERAWREARRPVLPA
jgi:hypothetical protein